MHYGDQYLFKKKDELKNIETALHYYHAEKLRITPFSLSYNKLFILARINDNQISFTEQNNSFILKLNKETQFTFTKDKDSCFKLEYTREENGAPWRKPDYIHPNHPEIPFPIQSIIRNVIDGYLVEIFFNDWVKIKEASTKKSSKQLTTLSNYWGIIPPDYPIYK